MERPEENIMLLPLLAFFFMVFVCVSTNIPMEMESKRAREFIQHTHTAHRISFVTFHFISNMSSDVAFVGHLFCRESRLFGFIQRSVGIVRYNFLSTSSSLCFWIRFFFGGSRNGYFTINRRTTSKR